MDKLTLEPNVPEQVALRFTDGRQVEGRFGNQMMYTLMDGRPLYVDLDVADKIRALGPRRAESFWICKRTTGRRGERPTWEVWNDEREAPPPSPASRATGIPDTDLERQLQAQLAEIQRRRQAGAVAAAPAQSTAPTTLQQSAQPTFNNGNGNSKPNGNGNGSNARPYEASAIPTPPVKIPYNVAFKEVLVWVTQTLKESGEQWSDQARQDMCSTVLIQAARDGYLTCWERGK